MCQKLGSCKMMFESTVLIGGWGWKESWGLAGKEEKRSNLSHDLGRRGGLELSCSISLTSSYTMQPVYEKAKLVFFMPRHEGEVREWIWTLYSAWSVLAPLL